MEKSNKKITQSEIAAAAGISGGFFSMVLKGKKRTGYDTAKRLARVTSTTITLWMDGSPEEIRTALKLANLGG